MAKQDAMWFEIDPSTLDPAQDAAYTAYKVLYRQAKDARQAFEERMERDAALPQGKRMIFGYNFGKLSVAVVEDDRKAPKAKTGKATLADFLALQGRGGHRV